LTKIFAAGWGSARTGIFKAASGKKVAPVRIFVTSTLSPPPLLFRYTSKINEILIDSLPEHQQLKSIITASVDV